ncbi:Uncharacterised protein [Mycobacteroides abscessus]|nr:Uncharacterised protein [Mycobacteroides abscessus]
MAGAGTPTAGSGAPREPAASAGSGAPNVCRRPSSTAPATTTTPNITAAMVTGGDPPSRPVTGATTAPTPNWNAPMRAAALPARCALRSSAMAGTDGMTKPAVPSVSTMSGTSHASPPPASAATRSPPERTNPAATVPWRMRSGVTRPTSAPLIWLPAVTDTAPTPKTIAYCCADIP